ncbi:hypothetical protein, partial [Roseinatronobacter sp.]|uniref:hypothetical protein n=1 Tax=Roseinatronobacter sp. TaxID=1945755 RepID=UPI0025DCBF11
GSDDSPRPAEHGALQLVRAGSPKSSDVIRSPQMGTGDNQSSDIKIAAGTSGVACPRQTEIHRRLAV